jgi:methylated-DNA-protein-cysteine methyltransferase-like protein
VSFDEVVYRLLRRVPRGHVVTYGQLAALAGFPRRARAVGHAMRDCPADVPWHRVVNAQGAISPRRRMSGMLTQRIRLEQEGLRLRGGRVSLRRHQWDPSLASRLAPRARRRDTRCVSR